MQKVSVPADQQDARKNKKMHHDNYELISSADGPLSTQIKYVPTSFKSDLFLKHYWKEKQDGCRFFSPPFVWLPLKISGCLQVDINLFY